MSKREDASSESSNGLCSLASFPFDSFVRPVGARPKRQYREAMIKKEKERWGDATTVRGRERVRKRKNKATKEEGERKQEVRVRGTVETCYKEKPNAKVYEKIDQRPPTLPLPPTSDQPSSSSCSSSPAKLDPARLPATDADADVDSNPPSLQTLSASDPPSPPPKSREDLALHPSSPPAQLLVECEADLRALPPLTSNPVEPDLRVRVWERASSSSSGVWRDEEGGI